MNFSHYVIIDCFDIDLVLPIEEYTVGDEHFLSVFLNYFLQLITVRSFDKCYTRSPREPTLLSLQTLFFFVSYQLHSEVTYT